MIPHLTPEKLIGKQYPKNLFDGIHVALVGFCPRPTIIDNYYPKSINYQPFIHIPPYSVEICSCNDIKFLSIVHVYGGVVASALLEELAYYGFDVVLAYGLAGCINTQYSVGDYYVVTSALVKDGTTPHYTNDQIMFPNLELTKLFSENFKIDGTKLRYTRAVTDDTIYREYENDIINAKKMNCDIINCDSSHLFAVCNCVGIKSIECGIISNMCNISNSELSTVLTQEIGPLTLLNNVIKIYVESMIPFIVKKI